MSCACFGQRHFTYSNYYCRASDIAAVGTIFNVFSYDAVLNRDSNQSPPRRRPVALRVEPRSVFYLLINIIKKRISFRVNYLFIYSSEDLMTTELIQFSLLKKLHIGPGIVSIYLIFIFKPLEMVLDYFFPKYQGADAGFINRIKILLTTKERTD